jgi:hypothetical protein
LKDRDSGIQTEEWAFVITRGSGRNDDDDDHDDDYQKDSQNFKGKFLMKLGQGMC